MVVAGYATVQGDRYAPVEDALSLLRGGAMLDVRAIVELLVPLGSLLPRVVAAVRDGAGIPSPELQATFGATVEQVNVPMYESLLLSEWIAGHPDVGSALDRGIDVAEVGPGGGTALRLLARAYPASTFLGADLDPAIVDQANAAAQADGLKNLRFEALDGRDLPPARYDLVCMFDAFHHLLDPGAMLDAMRVALRSGGSLLLAEAALSGDAGLDAADPTAIIVYGSDLMYCYQESKTLDSPGLGATWPGRGLAAQLQAHGFTETGRVDSRAGYAVIRAEPSASA
jgi:SAM-dependent methyltransferase